jgi:hypothetical protein
VTEWGGPSDKTEETEACVTTGAAPGVDQGIFELFYLKITYVVEIINVYRYFNT